MLDTPTKVNGDPYTTTEFNSKTNELENAVTSSGQTLNGGDDFQLSKSLATYSSGSDFYTDSGAANAYVLSPVGSKQAPTAYFNGMRIRFIAGNASTGAATVNVNSLGVENIKNEDGTADPASGDIPANKEITMVYDGSNFRIVATANSGSASGGNTVAVSGDDSTPSNLEDKVAAGSGISLATLNPGGNEQLQISSTASDDKVAVSGDDSTPSNLEAKVAAGTGISLTTLNPGGNEQLQITSTATAGNTIQVVNVQDGQVATGTATIPLDDTIPQSTEGTQFLTASITPTSATNELRIDVVANVGASTAGRVIFALFQDSASDAIMAVIDEIDVSNGNNSTSFSYYMVAGTASATQFKLRIGRAGAGTVTFNGDSGSRRMGGVQLSSITITEIAV